MILLYTAQMNNSGMMPCLAPHKSCNNDVKLNKEARCCHHCWGMLNACTSPPGCIVLKLRHCFAAFALFRSPGTIHVIVAELLKSLATSARGGRERAILNEKENERYAHNMYVAQYMHSICSRGICNGGARSYLDREEHRGPGFAWTKQHTWHTTTTGLDSR